ncbi:MAG: hypothetical protein ACYS29_18390, partial [Planctomycetota bacterium]
LFAKVLPFIQNGDLGSLTICYFAQSADFGEIGHRFRSKPATFSAKSATPAGVGGAAPSLSQFSLS